MSYSEDAQPNETRHARKGDARIPAIRSSRPVLGPHHRGYSHGRGRNMNQSSGRGRGSFGPSGNQLQQQGAHSFQDPGSSQSSRRSGQYNSYWHASKAQRAQREGMQSDNGWQGFQSHKARLASVGDSGPSKHEDTELEPLLATKVPIPFEVANVAPPVPGLNQDGPSQDTAPQQEGRQSAPELSQPRLSTTPSLGGPRPPWPYDPRHPPLSIALARRFFQPPLVSVAAASGSSMIVTQTDQTNVTPPINASPLNVADSKSLPADGPTNHDIGHGGLTTSVELADAIMGVPRNDYNPEAEVIDILEEPVTALQAPDVETDFVVDKLDNKAVRWGCWSALSSPPKIRSGTLVLSLSTPDREYLGDAPEPLLALRENSNLDVNQSPPPLSIVQPVSVCDTSYDDADGEEENRTTGRHDYTRVVQLRRDAHDKPRRLLALPDRGLLSVTMRGCLDLIEGPHSRSAIELRASPPTEANRQVVDDACFLSASEASVVVLGHARTSKQLSLLRLEGRRVCLKYPTS
ncbi:hypothetical protein C8Q73DRAFT_509666 [Cubamyces lactineus]|nr:hypothetical protein C8Q73DRAFT_509666 [Cubamyces lactineus]